MTMLAWNEPPTRSVTPTAAIPVDLLDLQGAPPLVVPTQILLLGAPAQLPANPRNVIGRETTGPNRP